MIKIDNNLTEQLIAKAKLSSRKRTNFNFHKEFKDPLQRMLNVMDKDTYVQPHKHENPDKREAFIVLKGKGVVIEFDENGNITDYMMLDPEIGSFGCDIPARTWHVIICLVDGSVFYEAKDGPYEPLDDKCFATWAPKEGEHGCVEYNQSLLRQLKLVSF